MGLAVKNAYSFSHAKKVLIQFLSLVLIVSTLSAVSIVKAPIANANVTATGTNANPLCNQQINNNADVTAQRIGNDCVVIFRESTTWTRPANVNAVRLLVIGGGGAGGGGIGGGGGAGEFVQVPSFTISASSSISIVIGGGGVGQSLTGGNGGNSAFGDVLAYGGAGGGAGEVAGTGPADSNGPGFGSGGGGSYWTRWPPHGVFITYRDMLGTSGSGRPALPSGGEAFRRNGGQGTGQGGANAAGGGGGGAGGDGDQATWFSAILLVNTAGADGGNGGPGRASDITGSSTSYAGGGGGGLNGAAPNLGLGSSVGSGLAGGGPGGQLRSNNNPATSNGVNALSSTGSGGGGASNGAVGGNGGSGIVVIRYTFLLPGTPTIGTVVAGNATASVPFTAPNSNGGSAITTYTATSNPGNVTGTLSQAGSGTITVNGLTNGTTYTFTVRATSAVGASDASLASNSVTPIFPSCEPTTSLSPPTGFTVLTFTSTAGCNWSVPAGVTRIDVLAVGGGGAGGTANAGAAGGGGGGQVTIQETVTVSGVLTIRTGAGGVAQSAANTTPGGNGGTSSVTPASGSAIATATGGSGGASVNGTSVGTAAGSGFNGGGGAAQVSVASTNGATGSGGNRGGAGNADNQFENNQSAGGGGGSGGAGVDAISTSGGAGGAGISTSFTGEAIVYGGGGGGGKRTSTGSAAGGTGGGGAGGLSATGTAGTINRGGGGGGAGESFGGGTNAGGAGGSGVVIIRYVNAPVLTATSVSTVAATLATAITELTVTTATNSGPATFTISPALPAGLTINSSTGTVSGTPTVTASAATYTITATNTSGNSTRSFSLSSKFPACSTVISSSGEYSVERITSTSTCIWTVPSGLTKVNVVVVGGGGGGGGGGHRYDAGAGGGGGGGGGEVKSQTSISVTTGNEYVITIGAGGTGGAGSNGTQWNGTTANNGGTTSAFGMTSSGGSGGKGAGLDLGSTGTSDICSATAEAYSDGTGGSGGASGARAGTTKSCTVVPGGGGGGAGSSAAPLVTTVVNNLGVAGGAGTLTDFGTFGVGGTGGTANASSSTTAGSAPTNVGDGGKGGDGTTKTIGPTKAQAGSAGAPGSVIIAYDITAPVITGPSGSAGASTSTASIAENTTTVTTFAANETVTWSKSGTDGSFFAISTSGELTISSRDFELPGDSGGDNTYVVAVTATDSDGNSSTQTLTLTITNEDDTAPTLSSVSASSTTVSGTILNFTSNEAGTYYYKIQTASTIDPANASAVETDATAFASANASANSVSITGLSSDTNYEIFVFVKDSVGNRSTVSKVTLTTLATATITYNSNGGTAVANGLTTIGASILAAPAAPTRANFTFAGWSDTDGGTAITFPYAHGKTTNFTLFAKWTANTYVLTYLYNSATSDSSTVTSSFTTGGTPIVLPTPSRIGYTFAGWHSNAALTALIGAGGANFSPTGVSLTPSAFAEWTALPYRVTYQETNKTGGAAPTDATVYNIGNVVIIKGNTGLLSRTGYTFAGWTAAADGTGAILNSGSTFTTSSSNMVFYPKWSANTYTITFNRNGGSGAPANTSTTYTTAGTVVNLATAPGSLSGLTRTGFDLAGWSESPTGSVISTGYTTATDVTLYAIWTAKTITLTYDKGAATSATIASWPTNTSASFNTVITLGTPTSQVTIPSSGNFEFSSWLLVGTSLTFAAGSTYTLPETNPTLQAQWVQVFEVRYTLNGGTSATGFTYDEQCNAVTRLCTAVAIQADAAPTRAGYTFTGWRLQNGDPVAAGGTFTVGINTYLLYAQWTAFNYSITYNTAGGSTAPTETVKQIGQTFAVAAAPTRTGYNFAGWSDGSSVFGAGVTYIVGTSPVNLTAQWTPKVYTVVYEWNGGSGSPTANDSYTVGNSGITLPVQGDRVKDGYTFGGWLTDSATVTVISGAFTPTGDTTLFAKWNVGTYTLTYNANGGTVSTPTATIVNGSSLVLPTPTRANFVFEGWYSAATGGVSIGAAGANFLPAQSRTVHARWTQSSLYGLSPSVLTRIAVLTASDSGATETTHTNDYSSVKVIVPAATLPAGTTINIDRVGDLTRAQNAIAGNNSYIISVVVSWITPAGTVPDTNANKAISVTITNASIAAGAKVYGIVADSVTPLGTATQNGTVTVQLTQDPEVVVIATKPDAPTNLAAATGDGQAGLTWSAPASDGGSAITGYTVTGTGGVTCTTINTSCTITGLTSATAYTYTVTATNSVGSSAASTSAGATTIGRPGAPTSVAASAGGTRQSVISWTAPASDGGSPITQYTATANGGATCATAATSCTITALAEDTTYTFTVIATNAIGNSDPSTSASARTASAVVNNTGGGGSVAPVEPVAPVAPVAPVRTNVTVVSPVTVVTDQGVKSATIDIATPGIGAGTGIGTGAATTPPTFKVDAASEKVVTNLKIVDGKLVVTVDPAFSGVRTVSVTITENGVDRVIQIPFTVNPDAVTSPVISPMTASRSVIRWNPSPNAQSYSVFLGTRRLCSTSATSCIINRILGPGSVITIVSNGGDRTLSRNVQAQFRPGASIQVVRIVSATITKTALTAVDTKALDRVVALIKNQGFRTVQISEIITTRRTKALADARIAVIKRYITSKIGDIEVKFEITPARSKTYFNYISVKG